MTATAIQPHEVYVWTYYTEHHGKSELTLRQLEPSPEAVAEAKVRLAVAIADLKKRTPEASRFFPDRALDLADIYGKPDILEHIFEMQEACFVPSTYLCFEDGGLRLLAVNPIGEISVSDSPLILGKIAKTAKHNLY